jgi:hypothetical protein
MVDVRVQAAAAGRGASAPRVAECGGTARGGAPATRAMVTVPSRSTLCEPRDA